MNITFHPLSLNLSKDPFAVYIDNRTWWDVHYGGRLDEIVQINVCKQDWEYHKYLPFIYQLE